MDSVLHDPRYIGYMSRNCQKTCNTCDSSKPAKCKMHAQVYIWQ